MLPWNTVFFFDSNEMTKNSKIKNVEQYRLRLIKQWEYRVMYKNELKYQISVQSCLKSHISIKLAISQLPLTREIIHTSQSL